MITNNLVVVYFIVNENIIHFKVLTFTNDVLMFRQSIERYDQEPKGRIKETNDAND